MKTLAHPRLDLFFKHRPDLRHALLRFIASAKRHEGIGTWGQLLKLKPIQAERLQLAMVREDKYSVASVKLSYSAARQLYRELTLEELITSNPLREVKVKGGRSVPSWNVLPADGGGERLLAVVTGKNERRDCAVIATLLDHGFRASTLCSITWGQVTEKDDGTATVTFVTKRGKQYTMKLKPRTVGLLKAHARLRTQKDHPLICKTLTGVHGMNRFDVYRIVKRWTKKLGLNVTPHGLRATFISDVIRRKGIEKARQLAGHENIETTVGYSRWVEMSDE